MSIFGSLGAYLGWPPTKVEINNPQNDEQVDEYLKQLGINPIPPRDFSNLNLEINQSNVGLNFSQNEFDELKSKSNQNKIKGIIIGCAICGLVFVLLSYWTTKQDDIYPTTSFLIFWWGIAILIIGITTFITSKLKK